MPVYSQRLGVFPPLEHLFGKHAFLDFLSFQSSSRLGAVLIFSTLTCSMVKSRAAWLSQHLSVTQVIAFPLLDPNAFTPTLCYSTTAPSRDGRSCERRPTPATDHLTTQLGTHAEHNTPCPVSPLGGFMSTCQRRFGPVARRLRPSFIDQHRTPGARGQRTTASHVKAKVLPKHSLAFRITFVSF